MSRLLLLAIVLLGFRKTFGLEKDGDTITLKILFIRHEQWSKTEQAFLIKQAENKLRDEGYVNKSLKFEVIDRASCSSSSPTEEYRPVKVIAEEYGVSRFDAIIGPYCSPGMIQVAHLATEMNMPVIGYLSVSGKLSDKTVFPTLARVSIGSETLGFATTALIRHFNWKRVALIWDPETFGSIFTFKAVEKQLSVTGMDYTALEVRLSERDTEQMPKAMEMLKANARIIIVAMAYYLADTEWILEEFHKANMTNPEYLFILPFSESADDQLTNINPKRYFEKTLLIGSKGLDLATTKDFKKQMLELGYPG